MRRFLILLVTGYWLLVTVTGCCPTYPKERFKESIVELCNREYKLDIKVETVGKTIAIYLALPDLIDFTFAITKEASDKINDVILSVSRVALSSDAEYDFYCIIAHDVRIPEIQIIIIKSVDDVKRFLLNDISRNEYSKRMLIDMRLSPQAQKEHALKEVFEKMGLDTKWRETVMNDFFRSEPAALGDIGYWNDRFYIKDISLAEFLAEQMASRIRFEFREDKGLDTLASVKSVKGLYSSKGTEHYFQVEILATPKGFKELSDKGISDKVFESALKVASHIMHGYRFSDFDYVNIVNQADNRILQVSRENLEAWRMKKFKLTDLIL